MSTTNVSIDPLALQLLVANSKQKPTKQKAYHHRAADPIRDEQDILKAKEWFLNQPQRYRNSRLNLRNYLLFTIGINLGRRVNDTINLKVGDFVNPNGTLKTHLEIKEGKTGKNAYIYINEAVREALAMYITKDTPRTDYLFQSRIKNKKHGYDPRLTTEQVNNIYQKMAQKVGIDGHISSHSTRKTAVYRMIKNGNNDLRTLISVQKFCNHPSFNTTLRYCGIQQDELDELTKNISI